MTEGVSEIMDSTLTTPLIELEVESLGGRRGEKGGRAKEGKEGKEGKEREGRE